MQKTILQSDTQKRGLVFDPRTKLFLLMTMAVFVLGGLGGKAVLLISPLLCLFPILLLITSKKYKTAVIYVVVYTIMYFTFHYFGPKTSGILNFLILGTAGIITRFMPSVMLGVYVVSTTTVSEFTAAMLRMHLSEKIAIAAAILANKEILIFDEPTSGLDYCHMKETAKMLNLLLRKRTVIVVSHDPELIMNSCTHVLRLEKGKVHEFYPLDEQGSQRLMNFFINKSKEETESEKAI